MPVPERAKQINFDLYCGNTMMSGGTLAHRHPLILRRDRHSIVCIPVLPVVQFGLIVYDLSRGNYVLQFDEKMNGEVTHRGKLTSFVEIIEKRLAEQHVVQELWCYQLTPSSKGSVTFGEWKLKFCFYREETPT